MSDYQELADKHVAKLRELRDKKFELEQEIRKTENFIKAAMAMMTDAEKGPYLVELQGQELQQAGLTQAIRKLLQSTERTMAATMIKQLLEERGYDFTKYKSNPLSTIHTILRRFKPSEVERVVTTDGTPGYHWKRRPKKALR